MKKMCMLLCFSLIFVASLAAEKITMVTGDWPPYTSEKMAGKGFFTEIVTAVCKEAGVDVEYKFYPWLRSEKMVQDGEAFAVFPYFPSADRKKIYDFSDPLCNSTGKFFFLKEKIKSDVKWTTFADLKSHSIGGTLGYWYKKDFEAAGLNVDYAASDEQGVKKLEAGRFDLLATDELVGWDLIKSLFPKELDKFGTLSKPLNRDALCLMVSRKYPNSAAINQKLNLAIRQIKKNGVYSAILKKYNITE